LSMLASLKVDGHWTDLTLEEKAVIFRVRGVWAVIFSFTLAPCGRLATWRAVPGIVPFVFLVVGVIERSMLLLPLVLVRKLLLAGFAPAFF